MDAWTRVSRVASPLVLSLLLAAPAPPAPLGGCPPVTRSPDWSNAIDFPDDPFRADGGAFGEPGWVKFTILTCDTSTVYFQDSKDFAFHYEFATQRLDPFFGLTLEQFNAVTLYDDMNRQAVLGAVVLPPSTGAGPPIQEYGIQLVGLDPFASQDVVDLFHAVKDSIAADPSVQVFYFPTFEQLESAQADAAFLAANGISISSPVRWAKGNSCYSHGWALGTLTFVPADEIEDAFLAGDLRPDDILLTDGIPAEIPLVAGVVSLAPATPNSHVAILARTFQVPFAFLALLEDADRALQLVGRRIVLRAFDQGFQTCVVDLIDVEDELTGPQINQILALKVPDPINLAPVEPLGAYTTPTDALTPADIEHVGGKAANYGFLRRAIPDVTPLALAISFDLWDEFLDQTMPGGLTLRQEIEARLSLHVYPPTDVQAFADDMDDIRDMIEDDTLFTPGQEAAVVAALQDPQYALDPDKKIRFRSSTNVEDGDGFTGAGLYESSSGCLQDDLDGDTVGPSLCDPSEDNERGVFRSIRKVFASFYFDNAVLERMRHGVDEDDVGMAILVHHSFPDELELANGVATYERGPFSDSMVLVTQLGAVSVTNPEGGAIPEQVDVSVFGPNLFPSLTTSSTLVQLGDTVMDWPSDYTELAGYLDTVADQYALETGKTQFLLDFEYKKVLPGGGALPAGGIEIDQVREIPRPDTTPSITPFLVNRPTDYALLQGRAGDVFANHRAKTHWRLESRNTWLTTLDVRAASLFTESSAEFHDGCGIRTLDTPLPALPLFAHNLAAGTTTDSWLLRDLENARLYQLQTADATPLVSESESPVLILPDLGSFDGRLQLRIDHALPVPSIQGSPQGGIEIGPTTTDVVVLVPGLPVGGQEVPNERVFDLPGGVRITSTFQLYSATGFCAGCILPLSRWEETVIEGLTAQPVVLHDDFAQSYEAGQHNFVEWFLFEPRLDPGVPAAQLAELQAQGIGIIVVNSGLGGVLDVAYLESAECLPAVRDREDLEHDGDAGPALPPVGTPGGGLKKPTIAGTRGL